MNTLYYWTQMKKYGIFLLLILGGQAAAASEPPAYCSQAIKCNGRDGSSCYKVDYKGIGHFESGHSNIDGYYTLQSAGYDPRYSSNQATCSYETITFADSSYQPDYSVSGNKWVKGEMDRASCYARFPSDCPFKRNSKNVAFFKDKKSGNETSTVNTTENKNRLT